MNPLTEALRELVSASAYRYAVRVAGLALAYFLAARIGLQYAVANPAISMVWPASGIALAAVLLGGLRLAPAVFIGALAANYSIQGNLIVSAFTGLGNSLEVLLGVLLLRRVLDFDVRMTRLRDVVCLIVAAATVSPLPAALLGPLSLALSGGLAWPEFIRAAREWWMGDSVGIVLVAPVLLTWAARPALDWSSPRFWTVTILLVIQLTVCHAVFGGLLIDVFGFSRAIYFVLPFAVWIALTHDIRFTALANAGLFAVAVWGTARGTGPFAGGPVEIDLALLHIFLVVYSITTLLVAAVNGERNRAIDDADSNAQRFRSLSELSSDWYWEQDQNLRFTSISGSINDPAGLSGSESLGKTRFELPNEFESEDIRRRHTTDLNARLPFRDLVLRRVGQDGVVHFALVSGQPIFDSQGTFGGYRGIGRDITERKLAERALRESEERFRSLTQLSSDWYWEQDADLRFTFVSSAIDAISGIEQSQRLGRRRWEIPGLQFDPAALEEHKNLLAAHKPFRDFRYTRLLNDGRLRYISVTGTPLFDAGGKFTGYRGIGREVTAEVVAEQRMGRLRDFYAALSKVNDAIIHATDPQRLFDEVCNIAVTYGHVIFARICLIDPRTGMLDNVAIAGDHQGYASRAPISIDPDRPEGRGPTAVALRTNTPDICNDIEADPRNVLWRPAMMATGARSYVVFPLSRAGGVVGSLHIYAAGKNWFGADLVALITELAENISFALDNFAREEARKTAAIALRASEQRFRDVAEAAGEFVWENDLAGRFTYVSPRVVEYTGYTPEEIVGHTAVEFMPPGEGERIRQWIAENTNPDRSFRSMEHMFLSKSGEVLWMQVSAVSIWDENGKPLGQRGTTRDISELKRSEARISYLATRDPLTELPNRLLFNDRLEQGIIAARRKRDKLGVLFLDLDRFKNINDSLGHHIGDLLLKEVAARMASCIRKGDTLSRLGGDEFVVTLEGLAHAEDAAQVAMKIITALRRPLSVGGHTLNTSCSIGISIFPNDAEDSPELMKNADTAMYHAKEQGRNNFQFFSPEMNQRAVERHRLETELRLAIEQRQFVLHYQPQADIRDGRLVGMEALIRWQHPQRGLVPPNSFIPVAEESGLIEAIGQWALRTACEQIQSWQAAGLPIVKIAVNISARQFNDPKDFADDVTRLLNTVGLDPRYLELEMTESMLLKNVDENVAVLRKLGKLGTTLAVDDFGTGYSSLAYLKQLPIDTLKIDRTFVRDIESDEDDAAIIRAIIAMAHSLGLRVTAEGVETKGQLAALRKLRCDQYQGYLLARPIPADEFAQRFLLSAAATSGMLEPARRSAGGPARKT